MLITVLFACLFSGCLNGLGNQGNPYDGVWNPVYTDKSVVANSASVVCNETYNPPSVTINNGSGNFTMIETCTYTAAAASGVPVTNSNAWVIGVAINNVGVVNANVNGVPITGQCSSLTICSAQGSANSVGLYK
jgi:hypothetical protein